MRPTRARLARPSHQSAAGSRATVSARGLREALARLYDLPYLQTHPLGRLLPSGTRSRGEALHRLLVDAVAALAPPGGASHEDRGRIHQVLTLAYVEGQPAREVCQRLGLSKSVYYREHARGIAALAALLEARRDEAATAERGGLAGPAAAAPVAAAAWRAVRALTSFVGRERALAELRTRLGDARLLTLTGPPGCGKTRLANELLIDLADAYAGGAHYVELAPLRDATEVLPAIARTLAVTAGGGMALDEALASALRERPALLVLDNFEHLLVAGPSVAALAAACPSLRVLVTSRALLRVYGEQEYALPPLALPGPGEPPTPDRLGEFAAIRLFVERARASQPSFALTEQNAAAVAQICRRLDGLPLAIELAAARVKLLPPPAILSRLERRLPALAGGARDLPERHRTLRGAIAWSYELLDADEQAVLRRAGPFVGGASLDALVAVVDPDGEHAADVGAIVEALVDKSLLQPVEPVGDEPRVRMLETIREFALEALEAAGDRGAAERAHAAYFCAFAERHEPDWGPQQPARLRRLERDDDNLCAALGWAVARPDVDVGLRLVAAIWPFWRVRGRWVEGSGWLNRVLALPGAEAPTAARAAALHGAGLLAAHLPGRLDLAAARAHLDESLALWRRLGNAPRAAWVTTSLGTVAMFASDFDVMRARAEECLVAFRALEDGPGVAAALIDLGLAANAAGEHERAKVLMQESAGVALEAGSLWHAAHAIRAAGMLALDQGDVDEACVRLGEALALARAAGDPPLWGVTLAMLGQAARAQGDVGAAASHLAEDLAASRDVAPGVGGLARAWMTIGEGLAALVAGDHDAAGGFFREAIRVLTHEWRSVRMPAHRVILDGLAAVARASGNLARAARLLGATIGIDTDRWGRRQLSVWRPGLDAVALRAAMGEEAFAAAWAEGEAMSPEQASAYALEDDRP